jgi:nucleotide-binding universal stress UspA family protein
MLDIQSILAPIDFSERSLEALRYTVRFAPRFGARISLIHVLTAPLPADVSHIPLVLEDERLLRQARQSLAEWRDAEIPPASQGDILVKTGAVSPQITEAARELAADLLVIATHGHGGLKKLLLGSHAERIVREAPCPVLVVRHSRQEDC